MYIFITICVGHVRFDLEMSKSVDTLYTNNMFDFLHAQGYPTKYR